MSKNYSFLANREEMGQLNRAKDWSKTAVCSIELWMQNLHTT